MIWRLMKTMCVKGMLVGFVRILLSIVFGIALATALRGGAALAGVVMGLTFAAGLACIIGPRDSLAALLSPDRPLWHTDPGLSLGRRVMLVGCSLIAAWLFWTCITAGLVKHGGFVAFLPLVALGVQRAVLRLGRRNVSGP